ncbi:MAG: hypothetical protein WCR07_10500, partial [Verrucomicrobiota bacterium]
MQIQSPYRVMDSKWRRLAWPGSASGAAHASPGQRPGLARPRSIQALKGLTKPWFSTPFPDVARPFRADVHGAREPGALPRAGVRLPLWGAETLSERGRPRPQQGVGRGMRDA